MAVARLSEISDTLRQRVLSAVHFQQLRVGSRLPSARTLALELGADARVIVAAYRALESEGLVVQRPNSRAFFVAGASGENAVVPATEWMVNLLAGGIARGVRATDFPEHARRLVETLRLRAACIECNSDQLHWLTSELQEDYGVAATGVELDVLTGTSELPTSVRNADFLLTTDEHEPIVRTVATRVGRPLIIATWRRDLIAEVNRLLTVGQVYFVGTDPRFADKLRCVFASVDGAANLHPVIIGRDDPANIPTGAPVWLMRSAREHANIPAQVRTLPTLRAFSDETQRAILRFVVHANQAALTSRTAHQHGTV